MISMLNPRSPKEANLASRKQWKRRRSLPVPRVTGHDQYRFVAPPSSVGYLAWTR